MMIRNVLACAAISAAMLARPAFAVEDFDGKNKQSQPSDPLQAAMTAEAPKSVPGRPVEPGAVRIPGRLMSATDTMRSISGHQYFFTAWLTERVQSPGAVLPEGVLEDFDYTWDDTSYLWYDFPDLKKDPATGAYSYQGEVVAVPVRGPSGVGVELTNGYRVIATTLPVTRDNIKVADQIQAIMYLEKSPAGKSASSYEGVLTLKGEVRAICFTLSRDNQEIPSFQERGLSFTGECKTRVENNRHDMSIRTCSGLSLETFSLKATGGNVFNPRNLGDIMPNPSVGTFALTAVEKCGEK